MVIGRCNLSHAYRAEQQALWHAVSEKLRATLVDMKKAAGGDAERPKVAWATMLKLVGNVVKVCVLHKYFVAACAAWLFQHPQQHVWQPAPQSARHDNLPARA